ncbi:MAG TPA: ABC transporter substrate-binding protein [Xanthobacteraceae bacterium]|jgi:ABC-type nitrate/sulfonate/bicarbonate transport system substrate-binding protein
MNILRIANRLAGACLLAALLSAALLSAGQLHAQGSSPEKLVISYVPGNAIYWDIDVAIEKGFFKDEGFAPEVVIFQSSPQSIQLLVAGEVQLAGAQPEALLAAVVHGSKGFAVISSPAERPDWFLVSRPEIRTLADLKGKFFGTGGLQLGENWWTWKALAKASVAPSDVSMLVVGTSAQKFAALQRGSIAFTVLFQPTAQVAVAEGMNVLYRFSDGEAFPSILYSVAASWAQQGGHGARLTRALKRAHDWLYDPGNREQALAILQKYTKREPAQLAPVYDLYVGKDAILSRDGAVVIADVDKVIAQMAENGAIPKGTVVSPDLYLLPRDLGGLAR